MRTLLALAALITSLTLSAHARAVGAFALTPDAPTLASPPREDPTPSPTEAGRCGGSERPCSRRLHCQRKYLGVNYD